LESMIE
jgi:hypothetical protein